MAPALYLLIFLAYLRPCLSYVDLDQSSALNHDAPRIPVPRPHQLPRDEDMRNEIMPSMITAIAPSTTMASNGTFNTMYSVHYHDHFVRRNVGKGIFKRGVFASDPPIATCTPCGGSRTSAALSTTTATHTASCTIHTYLGVFRSNVGAAAVPTPSYCYNSVYSGVFHSSTTSLTGLPCCFTIPSSCLANYSVTSVSYTFPSGVFRPSSTLFWSNFTQHSSTSASPSSSQRFTTVSSTTSSTSRRFSSSLSSSLSLSQSSSIYTSTAASTVPDVLSGVTLLSATESSLGISLTSDSTSMSSFVPSPGSSSTNLATVTITTVTVISSSRVTMSLSASRSPQQGPRPGDTSSITLSVVTARPPSSSVSPFITTLPNTVEGCGTASGSGIVEGSGTVYLGPGGLIPVVSSGTVSGFASKVVGCGTLIATSGSFSGSATVIGCGSGSGTATMTGTGTVWPAVLGGLIPIVSSGTVTGSGRVEGCGTLVGSGTFTATAGILTTIYPSSTPTTTTVEVYISYCPLMPDMMNMPKLGIENNATIQSPPSSSLLDPSPPFNGTALAGPPNSTTSQTNPLCHICDNDAGICCPLRTPCDADGHCPWDALQGSGYVLVGLNIVAAKNSSGSGLVGA